jgi:hypothetical protein
VFGAQQDRTNAVVVVSVVIMRVRVVILVRVDVPMIPRVRAVMIGATAGTGRT